jgi:hypothetical protein
MLVGRGVGERATVMVCGVGMLSCFRAGSWWSRNRPRVLV